MQGTVLWIPKGAFCPLEGGGPDTLVPVLQLLDFVVKKERRVFCRFELIATSMNVGCSAGPCVRASLGRVVTNRVTDCNGNVMYRLSCLF